MLGLSKTPLLGLRYLWKVSLEMNGILFIIQMTD
jgi:hypothetical protein